ncbi:MAG: ribonuclease HII [Bacteroides sp.]|nr:ribonuclease HII [Bacteroides sp.]MDE5809568.1 ribonuclease HII [Muribaculaceae bacterium]
MLPACDRPGCNEAGTDEAGRGCLAGPVFAAAVILPDDFSNDLLNDSKKLSEKHRVELREIIEREAVAWAVASVDAAEIDKINILNASILAMHRALDLLKIRPGRVIVDGNRFKPYGTTEWKTFVKGDGRFANIAAASILAKTYRDEYMIKMASKFPQYGWDRNKGYPTRDHRRAIAETGPSPIHRMSFTLLDPQMSLFD